MIVEHDVRAKTGSATSFTLPDGGNMYRDLLRLREGGVIANHEELLSNSNRLPMGNKYAPRHACRPTRQALRQYYLVWNAS